jgi:hypothetical protein
MVERPIHSENPAPTTTREQGTAIQTTWLNISTEVFRPLVQSMLRLTNKQTNSVELSTAREATSCAAIR